MGTSLRSTSWQTDHVVLADRTIEMSPSHSPGRRRLASKSDRRNGRRCAIAFVDVLCQVPTAIADGGSPSRRPVSTSRAK